jgi:hypothetical protein
MAALPLDCERFYRRDFLTVGAAGLLGLGLSDILALEARADSTKRRRKADSVILLWLGGGPATIDMWDLKPEAPEHIRGEFKSIATRVSGTRICEHLPKTAHVMDRCALVRSLGHSVTAHGPGTIYMATGHPPSAAIEYPSLGSLASKLLPAAPGVPPYLEFGMAGGYSGNAGFLGAAYNPFQIEAGQGRGSPNLDGISLPAGFTVSQLVRREQLRDRLDARLRKLDTDPTSASLNRFQQQALDILRSDKTRRAFDLDKEPESLRERYGRTPFGQSVLTARRLVEAGARFVTVGLGGWDTHSRNFQVLRTQLLPQLDSALSALITDLSEREILDRTIVYCAGEFGRTPQVNSASGRDHWARTMAVLLAGGCFRRGDVYGATDAMGMTPTSEPCSPADISATVFHALGIEPNHEIQTSSGRPMPIFREGKVLDGLIG